MADDQLAGSGVAVDPQKAVDAVLATPEPTSTPTPPPTEELPLGLLDKPTEPVTPLVATPPLVMPPPVIPPTETPTATLPAPEQPKPKRGGKILAFVVGFVLLVSGILGGFAYYANQFQKTDPIIAGILTSSYTRDQCHGCLRGGKLVWRNGECVQTGTCTSDDADLQWLEIKDAAKCQQAGGVYCAGCGGFCNISNDRGCNNLQLDKCGEGPEYGANIVACGSSAAVTNCQSQCGKCFDRQGACLHETTPGVQDGLCAVGEIADNTDGVTYEYFCPGMIENTQAGCQNPGKPANPNCYCGTVQVDGPNGVRSQTMTCGCNNDEEPPNLSLQCTGITRSPNTEVKTGDKVTFTCAGKLTGIQGNLSYKFRYQLNGGVWSSLTNKSTTTAELTVAACGTYKVQCQVCATVLNKTKCDPVWQAATTQ